MISIWIADMARVNPTDIVRAPVHVAALTCEECHAAWTRPAERWRLKVLFDESPPLRALYCPSCHAREFEE